MKRLLLPEAALYIAFAAWSCANEVVWTAAGTVTEVVGAGFAGMASAEDPVTIELRYDEDAPPESMAISDIPGLLTHLEYREDLALDLQVTIGAHTWRGTLMSGAEGRPYTVEVQDYKVGPGTFDFFKVAVAAEDGASFPSFPGAGAGAEPQLDLRFVSAESERPSGPDYLGSTLLRCVRQSVARIATATGTISDGVSGAITYAIEPGTIATELLGVQSLDLREVRYDPEFDEVTLRWAAVPGRLYVIEYLDEFLCWRELFSVFADETEESEIFFPAGTDIPAAQVYRVVEYE